jgi:uncharacterized protein YxjI
VTRNSKVKKKVKFAGKKMKTEQPEYEKMEIAGDVFKD